MMSSLSGRECTVHAPLVSRDTNESRESRGETRVSALSTLHSRLCVRTARVQLAQRGVWYFSARDPRDRCVSVCMYACIRGVVGTYGIACQKPRALCGSRAAAVGEYAAVIASGARPSGKPPPNPLRLLRPARMASDAGSEASLCPSSTPAPFVYTRRTPQPSPSRDVFRSRPARSYSRKYLTTV